MSFNWDCPHCGRAVTITDERLSEDRHHLQIANADGRHVFYSQFIVCPNEQCRKFTLLASLTAGAPTLDNRIAWEREPRMKWSLVPESKAKIFPSYVPAQILEDYREACLIRELSPKASATLSRRCLQGLIRDFWKAKPGRLVDEIEAIKDKVDSVTWDAIEAVRKIGNIGAHMEKDINVIVEVDPSEASLLIDLVETLIAEWYVQREERAKRMGSLVAAASAKKAAPSAPSASVPGAP